MSDKKQLPRAGFQLRKKPQQQDDTLIKLYKESELAKRGNTTTSAKETPTKVEKDDLSHNDEDVIEKASRKDSKLLAKEKEKNAKKLAKIEAKNAKKASKSQKKSWKEKKEKSPKNKKKLVIFLVVIFVLLGAGVALFFLMGPKISEQDYSGNKIRTTADEIYYSKLTGREVSADKVGIAATCIMIENSPDARPQSGLDQAGVIYEAIAEGGITRFMAIFQESKPQYIGPVRSLRMTYAEFANHTTAALLTLVVQITP